MRPPSFWNLLGSFRKSTISVTSSFGLVATRDVGEGDGVVGLVEHARAALAEAERPPLPPPCIWRIMKIQAPIKRDRAERERDGSQDRLLLFGLPENLTLFLAGSLIRSLS